MTMQSDPRILAIDEALIDVVIMYEQPDFPVEIPGSLPTNIALTLGCLGRPVALTTWIDLDERGRLIDFHMYGSGVHVAGASRGASHTSTALTRLDESGAASYTFNLKQAPAPLITAPPTTQVIEAGSISAIIEPGVSTVLDMLIRSREHTLVCFNPNTCPSIVSEPAAALASLERFIALADVAKVSDEDIEWLVGDMPIDEVVDRWLGMGISLVVITHGKHGSLAVISLGICFTKTPNDVKVVDTVGAGDPFIGGMIDTMWGIDLRDTDACTTLRALPEEQVRAIIDRTGTISDVTVSRKGANPPWTHKPS